MEENSTASWSVCSSKSHSYTWDVFSAVSLACDQKNLGHEPDCYELCKLLRKFYLLVFSLLFYKSHKLMLSLLLLDPDESKLSST